MHFQTFLDIEFSAKKTLILSWFLFLNIIKIIINYFYNNLSILSFAAFQNLLLDLFNFFLFKIFYYFLSIFVGMGNRQSIGNGSSHWSMWFENRKISHLSKSKHFDFPHAWRSFLLELGDWELWLQRFRQCGR